MQLEIILGSRIVKKDYKGFFNLVPHSINIIFRLSLCYILRFNIFSDYILFRNILNVYSYYRIFILKQFHRSNLNKPGKRVCHQRVWYPSKFQLNIKLYNYTKLQKPVTRIYSRKYYLISITLALFIFDQLFGIVF